MIAAGWDGAARGVVVVSDTIKPTSAQAVAEPLTPPPTTTTS